MEGKVRCHIGLWISAKSRVVVRELELSDVGREDLVEGDCGRLLMT